MTHIDGCIPQEQDEKGGVGAAPGQAPERGTGAENGVPEEVPPAVEAAVGDGFAEAMEELRSRIASLEEEKKDLADALARARADFFNYRKRVERDREKERSLAGEEKAQDFLPVLDNLDRAIAIVPETDGRRLHDGVVMVQKQFLSVLQSMGVEPVPVEGVPFSPEFHEALAAVETDDPEMNGIVVEEVVRGYRTRDRVLRPAKVRVAKYSEGL